MMTTEEAEIAFGPIPLISVSSAKWRDGFRISRLCSDEKKQYLWIEIEWAGGVREIRLTKTKTDAGPVKRRRLAKIPPA